jgi:uncharacterized protein
MPNEPVPPPTAEQQQQQEAGGNFAFAPWPPAQVQPAAPARIDPNNPPWGLVAAFLVWVASVALLVVMTVIFLIPYSMSKTRGMTGDELTQFLSTDKTAILLALLSGIPAHLLTLGVVWAVVTRFGKRPFWSTIGWTRGRGFGFWTSAGLAALLYIFSISMIYVFGQSETETALSRVIQSSRQAALALAFMALVTAPLVEELVYRGVLYSALHKAAGRAWAVVGVLALFTLVHVPQYWPNYGAIAAVGLLSVSLTLVRAYTGRLLPCFIMHAVFNGIQAVLILFEPYLQQYLAKPEQGGVNAFPPEIFRALF